MRKGLVTTVLITVGTMVFGLSTDMAKEIIYNFKNNHPNKVTKLTAKTSHKLNQQAAKFSKRVSDVFSKSETLVETRTNEKLDYFVNSGTDEDNNNPEVSQKIQEIVAYINNKPTTNAELAQLLEERDGQQYEIQNFGLNDDTDSDWPAREYPYRAIAKYGKKTVIIYYNIVPDANTSSKDDTDVNTSSEGNKNNTDVNTSSEEDKEKKDNNYSSPESSNNPNYNGDFYVDESGLLRCKDKGNAAYIRLKQFAQNSYFVAKYIANAFNQVKGKANDLGMTSQQIDEVMLAYALAGNAEKYTKFGFEKLPSNVQNAFSDDLDLLYSKATKINNLAINLSYVHNTKDDDRILEIRYTKILQLKEKGYKLKFDEEAKNQMALLNFSFMLNTQSVKHADFDPDVPSTYYNSNWAESLVDVDGKTVKIKDIPVIYELVNACRGGKWGNTDEEVGLSIVKANFKVQKAVTDYNEKQNQKSNEGLSLDYH